MNKASTAGTLLGRGEVLGLGPVVAVVASHQVEAALQDDARVVIGLVKQARVAAPVEACATEDFSRAGHGPRKMQPAHSYFTLACLVRSSPTFT